MSSLSNMGGVAVRVMRDWLWVHCECVSEYGQGTALRRSLMHLQRLYP